MSVPGASLSRHSSRAILLRLAFSPVLLGRRWQMTSQGLVLLFEVGTWPPHDGFRRMGWFNLWSALADDGREGLRSSTNSPHPSSPVRTPFLPEQNSLNLLSSAADRSCGLSYQLGGPVAPAELGAVTTHSAVRKLTARRLATATMARRMPRPLGHPHAPRLQPRPFAGLGEQRLRRHKPNLALTDVASGSIRHVRRPPWNGRSAGVDRRLPGMSRQRLRQLRVRATSNRHKPDHGGLCREAFCGGRQIAAA